MKIRHLFSVAVLGMTLCGCTAQQWQTTKDVMLVGAAVALVGIATLPPPPLVTTCRTHATPYQATTTCTTY